MTRRIAMWSGPRNLSTAMMRAWGNRPDTAVCDEPLYAYYLKHTGYTHHPGYREILAHHETDWDEIIHGLVGQSPAEKPLFYQKHMAHHLVGPYSLDWTDALTNVFLVRCPREMLLSLTRHFPNPTIEETGLPQQVELLQRVRDRSEAKPVVIDARDVLLDPAGMLEQLCEKIGVPFTTAMLCWRPGIHESDGIWAKHWYENVAESTGFATHTPRTAELPQKYKPLLDECENLYNQLFEYRLTTETAI